MRSHRQTEATGCYLPPASLWFGECSPLSVSSEREREREDGILFSVMGGGRGADNQVNEKESHLEQTGVSSFTSLISCRCPSSAGSTLTSSASSHVNAIQTDVLQRTDSSSLQDFAVPFSWRQARFYPVILNGFVICFCAPN